MGARRTDAAAVLGTIALIALASPALARDGVVEINQAHALAGGVTASDAPGFPVTLDARGSYELTGDLSPPAGKGAIEITADLVTLNLNGFSILGTATCTGAPVTSCTSHGGTGILDPGGSRFGAVVRDGAVVGMDSGIDLGNTATIERMRLVGNNGDAVKLQAFAVVRGCTAASNLGNGIWVTSDALVESSEMDANGNDGLVVEERSLAQDNRISQNGAAGILAFGPSAVHGNTMGFNSTGIQIFGSAVSRVFLTANIFHGNATNIAGAFYYQPNQSSPNSSSNHCDSGC